MAVLVLKIAVRDERRACRTVNDAVGAESDGDGKRRFFHGHRFRKFLRVGQDVLAVHRGDGYGKFIFARIAEREFFMGGTVVPHKSIDDAFLFGIFQIRNKSEIVPFSVNEIALGRNLRTRKIDAVFRENLRVIGGHFIARFDGGIVIFIPIPTLEYEHGIDAFGFGQSERGFKFDALVFRFAQNISGEPIMIFRI